MDTKKTEVKKPEDDKSKSENRLSEEQLDKVSGGNPDKPDNWYPSEYLPPTLPQRKRKSIMVHNSGKGSETTEA